MTSTSVILVALFGFYSHYDYLSAHAVYCTPPRWLWNILWLELWSSRYSCKIHNVAPLGQTSRSFEKILPNSGQNVQCCARLNVIGDLCEAMTTKQQRIGRKKYQFDSVCYGSLCRPWDLFQRPSPFGQLWQPFRSLQSFRRGSYNDACS